jgi:hypothetical protein
VCIFRCVKYVVLSIIQSISEYFCRDSDKIIIRPISCCRQLAAHIRLIADMHDYSATSRTRRTLHSGNVSSCFASQWREHIMRSSPICPCGCNGEMLRNYSSMADLNVIKSISHDS